MADTKISGLAAVTDVQATDEFVLARAGTTKKIDAVDLSVGLSGGQEFDYAQITSNVTVSATTAAAANDVVVGASVSYDGSTVVIVEFYAALVEAVASGVLIITLWDGATDLGVIAQHSAGTQIARGPSYARVRLTPSAASHQYKVKGWRTVGNGSVFAASATYLPAFLRVTQA